MVHTFSLKSPFRDLKPVPYEASALESVGVDAHIDPMILYDSAYQEIATGINALAMTVGNGT